jgi:HAD superfamily phosphatase (TIGR01668 family)
MRKGFFNLLPDYFAARVADIDAGFLLQHDVVIWDIDNTLFVPETTEVDPVGLRLFEKVNRQKTFICLSNSPTIAEREGKIKQLLGCELFISRYQKPSHELFVELSRRYRLEGKKVAMVGDRRITDVLFGNRHGLTTILVDPFSRKESVGVQFMRSLESLAALFLLPLGLLFRKQPRKFV